MLRFSAGKKGLPGNDSDGVGSLILRCRELRNGKMLEQALIPGRENLCGIGVKPGKELATMAAKLPKLTNAASYANWKKKVTEFILFYADGAQLIHLEHVRAWLELKVPLPPEFEHLPMEPGSMASASKAQLERMAAFNAQSRKFLSQAVKEAEATERILEYGSETISETDGDEVAQAKLAKAQADLPPGTTVDCKILERSQSEAGNEGEGLRSRWVSGCIVCEVKLENGHVQYLCFIPEDYSGKKVNRTQSFDHQDVRLKAGKTLKIASPDARLLGTKASIQQYIDVRNDAIANGYCVETWPLGILLWQLRQCSETAEDLNRQLYHPIVSTVADSFLRMKLQDGTDGDLVSFFLKCRERFGSNPAQVHIEHAQKYGGLAAFKKPEDLSEQIKRWLDYQREVDPHVFRLATVLNKLVSFIDGVRGTRLKSQLQSIYTEILTTFPREGPGRRG